MYYQRQAMVWPSCHGVYVLKKHYSILHRLVACQGCAYDNRLPADWLGSAEKIGEIMEKVCSVYGLAGWSVRLILGDDNLLWKKNAFPARTKKEALDLAQWDEALGDDPKQWAYDVCKGSQNPDKSYEWFLAAYPKAFIEAFATAFETAGAKLRHVDVLPALASRFWRHDDGTLYIREERQTHVLLMKDGVTESYVSHGEVPQDGKDWLVGEDASGCLPMWCREGNHAVLWSRGDEAYRKDQEKWDLAYPTMVLWPF